LIALVLLIKAPLIQAPLAELGEVGGERSACKRDESALSRLGSALKLVVGALPPATSVGLREAVA
jgi:hypothetical protein